MSIFDQQKATNETRRAELKGKIQGNLSVIENLKAENITVQAELDKLDAFDTKIAEIEKLQAVKDILTK